MERLPDINELACTVGGLLSELGLDGSDATYAAGVLGAWASDNLPGFDWQTWNASACPERHETNP
jgi:hypothetical protein